MLLNTQQLHTVHHIPYKHIQMHVCGVVDNGKESAEWGEVAQLTGKMEQHIIIIAYHLQLVSYFVVVVGLAKYALNATN